MWRIGRSCSPHVSFAAELLFKQTGGARLRRRCITSPSSTEVRSLLEQSFRRHPTWTLQLFPNLHVFFSRLCTTRSVLQRRRGGGLMGIAAFSSRYGVPWIVRSPNRQRRFFHTRPIPEPRHLQRHR